MRPGGGGGGGGGGGWIYIKRTASLCILGKLLPSEGVRPASLDNADCDGFIQGRF